MILNRLPVTEIEMNSYLWIFLTFFNYNSNFVTITRSYETDLCMAVHGGYIKQYYRTNKKYYIQFQQVVCSLLSIGLTLVIKLWKTENHNIAWYKFLSFIQN